MKKVRLTKKEAVKIFVDVNKDFLRDNKNDIPTKRFNWNTYTYYLFTGGFITVNQLNKWTQPNFIKN